MLRSPLSPHWLLGWRLRWRHLCEHWLWPSTRLAPVTGVQPFFLLVLAGMLLLAWAFAEVGAPIPSSRWKAIDILSEGLMALLCLVWLMQVRISRPRGPVTDGLCWGLALLAWGNFADWLDEFWKLPKAMWWLTSVEPGANLAGVLVLSWALHHWRHEQLRLNQSLGVKERGWRDATRTDAVTELGDLRFLLDSMDRVQGCWLRVHWQGFHLLAGNGQAALAEEAWRRGLAGWCALLPADALVVATEPGGLVAWCPGLNGAAAARACEQAQSWWELLLDSRGWPAGPGQLQACHHALTPDLTAQAQFLAWQAQWWRTPA